MRPKTIRPSCTRKRVRVQCTRGRAAPRRASARVQTLTRTGHLAVKGPCKQVIFSSSGSRCFAARRSTRADVDFLVVARAQAGANRGRNSRNGAGADAQTRVDLGAGAGAGAVSSVHVWKVLLLFNSAQCLFFLVACWPRSVCIPLHTDQRRRGRSLRAHIWNDDERRHNHLLPVASPTRASYKIAAFPCAASAALAATTRVATRATARSAHSRATTVRESR